MSLDTTPKSETADSFVDVATADSYLGTRRGYAAAWAAYNTTAKETWLRWATQLLDACFIWPGVVTSLYQALGWPRVGVTDKESRWVNQDTIPNVVQYATAELAFALSLVDRTTLPALIGQGFSEADVGPIKIVVDKSQIAPLIPPLVTTLLETIGAELDAGAQWSGSRVVRLIRA